MNEAMKSRFGVVVGLGLFALILLGPTPDGMNQQTQRTAAVAALMATWWLTEAVHMAVTALLPVALFPLLGILSAQEVASPYANHIVFLYIGGFVVAMAMERCNLHKRLALQTIRRIGSAPDRLMLGFMVATAFLSMWISNTATTMMMLPIALAVIDQLATLSEVDGKSDEATQQQVKKSFSVILLLGIAYSASVGGVGTIIGTPTNVAFLGYLSQAFPDMPEIGFVDWMMMAVPIVIVFVPIAWVYLCRFAGDLPLHKIQFHGSGDVIDSEINKLGPMRHEEKLVATVASTTALLWIFRKPIMVGDFTLPGWSQMFEDSSLLQDSTVAMVMATLLFLLPSGKEGKRLMDWETVQRGMPWGIVFLFGGGFALADAISVSGLADWMGLQMVVLEGLPVWILVPISCLIAVLMTEMTSNIATVMMLSPVITATALQIGVDPYLLLIPAAIMASFAFMLPVATPPNAIVFSSGTITIGRMFRVGSMLDLIALFIVPVMIYWLGGSLLGQ
jgi:sodium-dependent dicarboxylate transporter 2/3/5